MTRQELHGKIDVLFGGRAAEQLVFDDLSTGAQNGLQRATEIARAMVLEYGMGATLGPVTFPRRHPLFLSEPPRSPTEGTREYSEATAQALYLETKRASKSAWSMFCTSSGTNARCSIVSRPCC
jgi:cell division protease FtsH